MQIIRRNWVFGVVERALARESVGKLIAVFLLTFSFSCLFYFVGL
jgi:hypothetical protein